MDDFDFDDSNDPLDLLNDDGDGIIEMCTILDEDDKQKPSGPNSPGCMVLLALPGLAGLTAALLRWC